MRRSRRSDDRGVALLEFALVLPLLAMLAFVTVELGLAWVAKNRVEGAVATAARVGASSGAQREADRDVLLALKAALPADDLANLDRVIIYRATAANGAVPEGCKRPFGESANIANNNRPLNTGLSCNSYSGGMVRALTDANYGSSPQSLSTSTNQCPTSGITGDRNDRFWCPRARRDTLSGPPDWLGVWIRIRHDNPVPFFFDDFMFEESSVFRIQPDFTG